MRLDHDGMLSSDTWAPFCNLLQEYDSVFDSNIKGHNGKVGPFPAKVNMGLVAVA